MRYKWFFHIRSLRRPSIAEYMRRRSHRFEPLVKYFGGREDKPLPLSFMVKGIEDGK